MENVDRDILNILNNVLSEEQLDKKIYETQCLKSLLILLELKRKRILDGKSKKICYPVHKIYEQETEDMILQCEVLKIIFLIVEKPEEEILRIIMYLNFQFDQVNSFSNSNTNKRIALLLNEIILICEVQKMEWVLQEHVSSCHIDRFFIQTTEKQNPLKTIVLSTVLPNYVRSLNELHQLQFLQNCFLKNKEVHNLDVMCVLLNQIDKKTLLANCESILFLDDFWEHLENSISSDIYDQQKEGIFLLKTFVQAVYDYSPSQCKIPYLQTTDISICHQAPNKIWQIFFILLDASKEKQLHLIRPSLTLLNSLKFVNEIWQICIYKKLLMHSQNAVVYYVASHILHNNIFFSKLNKCLLSAINKNEHAYYCTKMFNNLPGYYNTLKLEDFLLFLEDILEITWVPTAAWHLCANTFSKMLNKVIPFKFVEPMYKVLKRLPHVYIRNGCLSIFFNYIVRNFNWKNSFDDILKLLFILKDHDSDLFVKSIANHIDSGSLIDILNRIKGSVLDMKTFEIYVQMIKISKFEIGMQAILENMQKFNKKLQLLVYANLFDRFKICDIEKFVIEQIVETDEDCTNMFLIIIKELSEHNAFSEIMYSKVLHILSKPSSYSKTTISIALHIILNLKNISDVKETANDLKHRYFDCGKTDDDLCILVLQLYLLTEKYPEIPFLECMLHNQSDIVISKMFECLSAFSFHRNNIKLVYFLINALNIILNLSKSRNFKTIIFNYINCIFSKSFLETLYDLKLFDEITLTTDRLLSLSETFPIIDYYLSEKIKETTFRPQFSRKCSYIVISVVEELLLRGIVVKKDDGVEYSVCQEIYEKLGNAMDNPNFIKVSTRMSSLESMLHIVSENPEYADNFTVRLITKYRLFNKRYFPDSQIHLQKLRIVQALLTIHPFIKSERQLLIDLIDESFCKEIHQPCVKQLLQWLLFALLKNHNNDYFSHIKAKIDTATKTQPSTIASFIVVLLQLTLHREESFWFLTIEALVPWSMGANFKLRVYSQAAIKKLLEEGKQRHYEHFLVKYSHLEKSVLSVIEASGNAFYDTLKSDELVFSVFDPEKYYSLETIYIDIPKLNGVTRTEWESISQYKFVSHKNIDMCNKNTTFSNSVAMSIENNNKENITADMSGNTQNIQRKINPWKNVIEEREGSKQMSDFILIASLIDKSTNLGGLSRTCEVFGVKQLVLNDIKILNDKEFKSLSMSSEDWVNVLEVKVPEVKEFILKIRNKGYSVIGAEQTSDSICLHKYKFNKKTALVLGNEKEGIPPDIIPILDGCIEIPQFGMVRSLNVHVAGATFIWEYAKQHLV